MNKTRKKISKQTEYSNATQTCKSKDERSNPKTNDLDIDSANERQYMYPLSNFMTHSSMREKNLTKNVDAKK